MGYPGVVKSGSVIYFMHPIFRQYGKNAPRWVKLLLLNALNMLLPEPLVRLKAPSSTLVTLNAQPGENRQVLHLLHYIPERRGQDFDVIEDVIPLYDVGVSVRVDEVIQSVVTAPDGDALEFSQAEGRVVFTLPKLEGHQMIVIQ